MKIVIGAGISGLIYTYYNKDCMLVGNISKVDNPFVYIQKNNYTDKLISDLYSDLGIFHLPKIDSVQIVVDNKREEILDGKINGRYTLYEGTDRISNVGSGLTLDIYSISELDLCNLLLKCIDKQRHILNNVSAIYKDRIVLDNGRIIADYESIISTVHFKTFSRLCGYWEQGNKIVCGDYYYDIEDYDDIKNKIVYPSSNNISKIVYNAICGKKIIEKKAGFGAKKKKNDARFSGTINPSPEKVTFIGRFATGNPHWRIEDSIFVSSGGQKIYDIICEQARFDQAIKEVNKSSLEERVKDLVLHCHSELSELLREVNWKTNKNKNKKSLVKATSVLEEGVDCLKLIFAILNEFGYTPREVYEAFSRKDKENWNNFLNDFFGGC